jgi:hypothetical protein
VVATEETRIPLSEQPTNPLTLAACEALQRNAVLNVIVPAFCEQSIPRPTCSFDEAVVPVLITRVALRAQRQQTQTTNNKQQTTNNKRQTTNN